MARIRKGMAVLAVLALLAVLFSAFPAVAGEATASFKKFTAPVSSTELDLGKVHVALSEYDAFYAFLSQFPDLRKVDMFSTVIDAAHIEALREKFPGVEFGWTMKVGSKKVRTDITAFSTRHTDTSTRRSEKTYYVLKYCKNLQALDLGHNSVHDLSFLYEMPQLKVLILVDNNLQDITPIAFLENLEYLELFYNDIRDIRVLSGLKNLKDLNICFNRIEDLSPLLGLTQLERLWISHSNSHNVKKQLDAAMVEQLRQALPDTQVDTTAKSSIGNHWRDHPRYKILRKMFLNSEYLPFE